MLAFIAVIAGLVLVAFLALAPLFCFLVGAEFLLCHAHLGRVSRFLLLVVKSVRRNPLRTSLSYLAAFVLVAVVTMIWSALYVLDHMTEGRARDVKVIVREKWQDNSEMPLGYA